MVYLGGDNNLSDAGEADLAQMAAAGSTAVVNIVAQFDRKGKKHHTRRYHVRKSKLQEVADLGETNYGDPGTLLDFIGWAAESFPAERYALILWNHGSGWPQDELAAISRELGFPHEFYGPFLSRVLFRSTLKGSLYPDDSRSLGLDDSAAFVLGTVELARTLRQATDALGRPIDLLGMDGCFGSSLELAYQVRECVRYVVASEENEPFDGWPYTAVLQKLVADPDISTSDFAAHIVDTCVQSHAHTDEPVIQAAVDLSKAGELAGALDELADALLAHMPAAGEEIWNAARPPAANFWRHTLWDISHFCERLEAISASGEVKAAAQKVRQAVGNLVVAEAHQGKKVEHCGGVTVCLTPPPIDLSRFYAELDFAADYRWDELLAAYHEPG
jgi:hypothetical protein